MKHKTYDAPQIKVVAFEIEKGFTASGFTQREENTAQYEIKEASDGDGSTWGTFN